MASGLLHVVIGGHVKAMLEEAWPHCTNVRERHAASSGFRICHCHKAVLLHDIEHSAHTPRGESRCPCWRESWMLLTCRGKVISQQIHLHWLLSTCPPCPHAFLGCRGWAHHNCDACFWLGRAAAARPRARGARGGGRDDSETRISETTFVDDFCRRLLETAFGDDFWRRLRDENYL